MKVKIDKRHYIISLLSIIILVIGIYIVIRNQQALAEPVYFRHLVQHYLPPVADSVMQTSTINLIYITDSKDEYQISNVRFDDHPELKVMVYNTSSRKYGPYYENTVCLYLEWESYEAGISDEIAEIRTMLVEYANHTSQIVDTGKICIYGGIPSTHLLEATGAMPFMDKERIQTYETKENLQLIGLSDNTVALMEEMDIMDYTNINEIDYRNTAWDEPLSILTDNQVEFKMVLKDDWASNLLEFNTNYDYYNIEPKLIFLDEAGNEHFVSIINQPKNIYFKNYREVIKYLKVRGAI